MGITGKIKKLVQGDEEEKRPDIPRPYNDGYIPGRHDLSHYDLTDQALLGIFRRRANRQIQDREWMREFKRSFGVIDEEDF